MRLFSLFYLAVQVFLLLIIAVLPVRSQSFYLDFIPEAGKFNEAAGKYDKLWLKEGAKIVEVMEDISGLEFDEDDTLKVVVYEGPSYSGDLTRPMKMRASYPEYVKIGTLIHELGHRLIYGTKRTEEIDEHRALFLILYDIWSALYGKEFADKNVAVENKRKGIYDYESAWKWALSFSKKERSELFKSLLPESKN